MAIHLAMLSLLVRDYDEAIEFYTKKLGFSLVEDSAVGSGKRWVVVAPAGPGGGAALLLAKAANACQSERIGDQTGGRVFLFLRTDDFDREHARLLAGGVRFLEAPRVEPYGKVAVFEDLYGNRWDLVEQR